MNGDTAFGPCLLCFMLLYGSLLRAQDSDHLRNMGESLLLDGHDPSQVEAWCEEQENPGGHPLDLNSASAASMEATGLFSSYQIRMFILYKEKYGDLLSVFELGSVEGFSPAMVKELLPQISVGASSALSKAGTGIQKTQLHGSLRVFSGTALPRALAYGSENEEGIYYGSAWNTGIRMECKAGNRIRAGLAFQKDPGETAFRHRLPEHLSAFLAYNGKGILEQCIVGNFHLQCGSGLLIGTGGYKAVMELADRPRLRSLSRPYAGNSEWGIHQGLVLSLRSASMATTLWTSLQRADLGLSSLKSPPEADDWQVFMRESGLHRTDNEIAGRGLAFHGHSGINAEYSGEGLRLGILYLFEYNGLTARGRDSLEAGTSLLSFHRASLYGKWTRSSMQFFAELSPGKFDQAALLCGMKWRTSPYMHVLLQSWYYGSDFRDHYSTSFSHSSRQQNEQGVLLLLTFEPSSWLRAKLSLDLYGKAGIQSYRLPETGHRFKLQLESPRTDIIDWRIRMYRQSLPSFRDSVKTRLEGRFACQVLPGLRWHTALAIPDPLVFSEQRAWAMLQEFGWNRRRILKVTAQAVLFHLSADFEKRICFYRPGPYRHFSFPSYSGNGNSLTLYLSLSFPGNIILEGNISRIRYYDRANIGSGRGITQGSSRLNMMLQCRLKF